MSHVDMHITARDKCRHGEPWTRWIISHAVICTVSQIRRVSAAHSTRLPVRHLPLLFSTLQNNAERAISVCPSVTRVDQLKTDDDIFTVSISLVFAGQVSSKNYNGFPPARWASKKGGVWKHAIFLAYLCVNISKTVQDTY